MTVTISLPPRRASPVIDLERIDNANFRDIMVQRLAILNAPESTFSSRFDHEYSKLRRTVGIQYAKATLDLAKAVGFSQRKMSASIFGGEKALGQVMKRGPNEERIRDLEGFRWKLRNSDRQRFPRTEVYLASVGRAMNQMPVHWKPRGNDWTWATAYWTRLIVRSEEALSSILAPPLQIVSTQTVRDLHRKVVRLVESTKVRAEFSLGDYTVIPPLDELQEYVLQRGPFLLATWLYDSRNSL